MAEAPKPTPVFVFGALRSGTTVFRLMLDAHESIVNPGEVDFLFDHLQRDPSGPGGWRYRKADLAEDRIFRAKGIDLPPELDGRELLLHMLSRLTGPEGVVTTLTVHRHPDRLLDLLPNARIFHMLRDPRDVARSSIGMGWAGNTYYGVDHWIATEKAWDGIKGKLNPDQVLNLRYEDLFGDTEAELRRVCAFLGMPYSFAMLTYHETSTYAPPDSRLVEQWRRKLSARDVALVESKAGRLMLARGYAPAAAPHDPRAAERVSLWLSNKTYRFRFKARRYGFALVAGEMLTRRLGLARFNRHLRREINRKTVAYLK